MKGRTPPDWIFPLALVLLLLVAWELAVHLLQVPARLVPGPSVVVGELVAQHQILLRHGQATMLAAFAGFFLALALSVPLGILIASSSFAERRIYPLLAAADTIPKIGVAPLLIIFFGFGVLPRILVAFSIAFFPIVLGTVVGLKGMTPELKYLSRSMGASRLQTLVKIALPRALPSIFGGVKIAVTLAVTGAMVAEFVAPREGLGYLLVTSSHQNDGPLMFAAIVGLVALGLGSFAVVDWLERRVLRWHTTVRRDVAGGAL